MNSMFRKDTGCFIGLGPMGREVLASCILVTTQRTTPCSSSASKPIWRGMQQRQRLRQRQHLCKKCFVRAPAAQAHP
jgi:hypothetical protein|tara:strand:- start:443 stop:673 length:231 start_codon:yes stop_codon:yes gene_type:complete